MEELNDEALSGFHARLREMTSPSTAISLIAVEIRDFNFGSSFPAGLGFFGPDYRGNLKFEPRKNAQTPRQDDFRGLDFGFPRQSGPKNPNPAGKLGPKNRQSGQNSKISTTKKQKNIQNSKSRAAAGTPARTRRAAMGFFLIPLDICDFSFGS